MAILTWILPSGEFERKVMETSAGERSVAVAGTYHSVDKVLEDGTNLRQGIAQVLMAPGKRNSTDGRGSCICLYYRRCISDYGQD